MSISNIFQILGDKFQLQSCLSQLKIATFNQNFIQNKLDNIAI
jgi:hypothetical protein